MYRQIVFMIFGILITIGILYMTSGSVTITWWIVASALLHELAHYGAMRLVGMNAVSFHANPVMFHIKVDKVVHAGLRSFSRVIVALAGPTVQVVFIVVFMRLYAASGSLEHLQIAYTNATLLAYNMLALPILDGGKVYRELFASTFRSGEGLYWLFIFSNVAFAMCVSQAQGFIAAFFGFGNAMMLMGLRKRVYRGTDGNLTADLKPWQTAVTTILTFLYAQGGLFMMESISDTFKRLAG